MIKRIQIFVLTLTISILFIYCIWKNLIYDDFDMDYFVPQTEEETTSRFEDVNFRLVTAFSGNHFKEALRSCYWVGKLTETKQWKNGFMIAYLLENDLSKNEIDRYQKVCPFVELRQFPFEIHPHFIKNLFEYRWKPLIIEEMINEFDEIFYFDTSVVFKNSLNETTIKGIFDEQKQSYSKCGMREFEPTGHTIFAATNPEMYKYFDFTEAMAKSNLMYGATMFAITRSKKSKEIIEKWVKCAKERGCMAPVGSQIHCKMEKLKNREYANCHRFDQSALAILLRQCSEDPNDYFLASPLVKVERL